MKHEFPKMPDFRARWAPIYMEPIIESGEKITIGIVAIPEKGSPVVIPVLNQTQVLCAFGENGLDLLDSAKLCLDTLNEHLYEHPSLTAWIPPLFGVTVGLERLAAGDSIEEVIQMAMRSSASFSATLIKGGVALGDQFRELDPWEKQIEETVARRAPDLKRNFHQSFSVIEGISNTRFDYLGNHYIANFGKIGHPTSEINAKAKLLNLMNLAEIRARAFGQHRPNLELILLRPPSNGQNGHSKRTKHMDEVLIELSEVCRRHELKAFPVLNAGEASEHILEMESAA